jgi:hypothetical protein
MPINSVFNPMNLVLDENMDSASILDNYVEESYFRKTLDFIMECKREANTANKKYYKTVLESQGNRVIVHEAFSDFFGAIKKIIAKIIEFIKSLVKKFITAMHSMFKSEKYLIKHKDDLHKFGSNHEFKFEGYNFSFSPNIPALTAIQDFNKSMEDLKIQGVSADELKKKYDQFIVDLDDNIYDLIRAQTIGKGGEAIYQSNFANELFSVYRGDQATKEEMTITSAKVSEFYDRFANYKSFETQVKKDQERVEKEYDSTKKLIDKSMKRNADGKTIDLDLGSGATQTTTNKDVVAILDLFVKAKSNEIQEISNIHALAFSAKLDAINDCFKQDKSVLYKALYKVQGMKKDGVNESADIITEGFWGKMSEAEFKQKLMVKIKTNQLYLDAIKGKSQKEIDQIDKKIESKSSIVYTKVRSNPKYHETSWYIIYFLILGLIGVIGYAAYSSEMENEEISTLANEIGLDIKYKGGKN